MTVTATFTASPPATPAGTPSPVDSRDGSASNPRLRFVGAILRILPPWLRRTVGGAIMKGLATPIDDEVNRDVEGVELRFPGGANGLSIHSEALSLLGRERRILRGPEDHYSRLP